MSSSSNVADIVIGVDIGTTATKAVAFGLDGEELASASASKRVDW